MEVRKRNVISYRLDEVVDANKHVGKIVTNLDAFPKLPEDYQRQTTTGAAITILAFILIIILVMSELIYYSNSHHTFQYDVDPDFTSGLHINVDLVVAMPCGHLGADVLDITGQNTLLFGQLEEDDVVFELAEEERLRWDVFKQMNQYVKEEYHALHDLLWRRSADQYNPEYFLKRGRAVVENRPVRTNACRLHGTLQVNKVAGNFHVTAGRVFPHPAGHAHISAFLGPEDYNFSHRISKFSFTGDDHQAHSAIINPLDGDEKTTSENYYLYQYIIKVVPTDINTRWSLTTTRTHQYSVTEQERSINHSSGSHGVPGIYFKYDFSPFKVTVSEQHEPYWQFLVRLCGIIGGVFTTLGIISSCVGWIFDRVYGTDTQQQQQQQQQLVLNQQEVLNKQQEYQKQQQYQFQQTDQNLSVTEIGQYEPLQLQEAQVQPEQNQCQQQPQTIQFSVLTGESDQQYDSIMQMQAPVINLPPNTVSLDNIVQPYSSDAFSYVGSIQSDQQKNLDEC